jgi:hypothetical protein
MRNSKLTQKSYYNQGSNFLSKLNWVDSRVHTDKILALMLITVKHAENSYSAKTKDCSVYRRNMLISTKPGQTATFAQSPGLMTFQYLQNHQNHSYWLKIMSVNLPHFNHSQTKM